MNVSRLLILLVTLLSSAAHALFSNDEEELLEAEKAFAVQAVFVDPDTIGVSWDIADGYYMYRERISFASPTRGIVLGNPQMPTGKVKEDEFFGRMEIYRGNININLPVSGTADAGEIQLVAKSQGCADIGVCYPPLTQTITLEIPPAASADALARLTDIGNRLGLGGDDEPLPADEAFAFSGDAIDGNTILLRWDIAGGYYLYRDKIGVRLADDQPVTVESVRLPDGEIKQDEFFGRMEVYHDSLEAVVKLSVPAGHEGPVRLAVSYQGCAEMGICYPPIHKVVDIGLPPGTVAAAPASPAAAMPATTQTILPEQDRIADRLRSGNLLLTLAMFLGFGLLLAFTPCVFPMIPILSSIIVGQGDGLTTRRAFMLSLIYVLAMALTYTAAGVIAGLFGANLTAAFQNPWVLSAFAGIFVLLALSMFGLYDLQMPGFIQSRLAAVSNRQEGGTYAGVAIMGFLSALIVGPCVAAPLAGALIYIGQTGDAVLGGLALFALSLGMGAPLLAIGTGAGKLLPKAGGWMDAIKAVFGIMLLGLGIWMLERILPAWVTMLLWSILVIVSAVYLGAFDSCGPGSSGWRRLSKGFGLVFMVYGILLMLGAVTGGDNVLKPLEHLRGGISGQEAQRAHVQFVRIKSVEDLQREIGLASQNGQFVMVDFYADWCVACKELEKYTFSNPLVVSALSGFRALQADVTANDAVDRALMKHLGVIGPPSVLFFDPSGKERRNYRVVGFVKPEAFAAHVRRLDQAADMPSGGG